MRRFVGVLLVRFGDAWRYGGLGAVGGRARPRQRSEMLTEQ